MRELTAPPEGYQSVKGVCASDEVTSFFKASTSHTGSCKDTSYPFYTYLYITLFPLYPYPSITPSMTYYPIPLYSTFIPLYIHYPVPLYSTPYPPMYVHYPIHYTHTHHPIFPLHPLYIISTSPHTPYHFRLMSMWCMTNISSACDT